MNAGANRMYWAAWSHCAAALKRAGVRSRKELDSARHGLHISALGFDKPHAELNELERAQVTRSFHEFARAQRGLDTP